VFEVSERELIKSSETMGNMPETLKEIADELENFQRIQQKIKSAMSYPIVLIVFAVLAVSVLLVKVVPTIISLFPCQEMLPWITRFMIQVSDFMIKWWWILIIWAV
jgi:type II secretory pathway component PulF